MIHIFFRLLVQKENTKQPELSKKHQKSSVIQAQPYSCATYKLSIPSQLKRILQLFFHCPSNLSPNLWRKSKMLTATLDMCTLMVYWNKTRERWGVILHCPSSFLFTQVIAAEGEHKAARALKEASDIISQSSSALQLRYLQTLNTISAEKNSTIIFPIPIEFITQFVKKK